MLKTQKCDFHGCVWPIDIPSGATCQVLPSSVLDAYDGYADRQRQSDIGRLPVRVVEAVRLDDCPHAHFAKRAFRFSERTGRP